MWATLILLGLIKIDVVQPLDVLQLSSVKNDSLSSDKKFFFRTEIALKRASHYWGHVPKSLGKLVAPRQPT